MTISYITGLSANQQSSGTTNTATTGQPLDTTGANLIVVSVTYFDSASIGAVTVTDSNGNTYTALNNYGGSGADHQQRVFYCLSPIVGANHTFIGGSASSISSLSVVAFSGVATSSPVDQQNGFYQASGGTIQAGSITPTQNNALIISALEHRIESGLATIDSGFTLVDQRLWDSGGLGTAIAYKIQTTASAVNPAWTLPASVKAIAASVSFKAEGGGGGNATPTFPGPNIGNQTGTVGSALSSNTVSDSFSDGDALTFSAIGSWPAGVTVSSAGVISGTPTTAGTYASLQVRATDTAAQTVDSDTFSFTISAAAVNGTITIPAVRDWGTGNLKVAQTGVQVDVLSVVNGNLVVRKIGQTTHATTANLVVTDAAIVAGTLYGVIDRYPDGSKGYWEYTAT